MIRPIAALLRQAQDLFQMKLVGIYRWDDVKIAPKEKTEQPKPYRTSRGRIRRDERPEGRYHASVSIEFGLWGLVIEGPNEHPPLGWIKLDGPDIVEGPLDPATWTRIGDCIKQKHEEMKNVA